jgi:hypothetical protein
MEEKKVDSGSSTWECSIYGEGKPLRHYLKQIQPGRQIKAWTRFLLQESQHCS